MKRANWNPNELVRIAERARHVPVHRVSNVRAVANQEQEAVMVCGWQPSQRGLLLTSGAARAMEGLFCRGCWRAER